MTTPAQANARKVSITIQLDPDQCDEVERIASLRRTGRAAVVREAVALYLLKNIGDSDIRFPATLESEPVNV